MGIPTRKERAISAPDVRRIGRPFRFYDFTDEHFKGGFSQFRRLVGQIRQARCRYMTVEEISPERCSDIRTEEADLLRMAKRTKGFKQAFIKCEAVFRLGFFREKPEEKVDSSLFGYAIVGRYRRNI